MKLSNLTFLFFITTLFLASSCQQNNHTIITKKIQYDVNIKSPNPDYDWWIQNIPGSERESLVEMIIEGARAGDFQAYDYFNKPMSVAEVNSVMADTMILKLMRTEPPYDLYDTTIVNIITNEDIQKLRFMEKWVINSENLKIEKTVYAIAPIAQRIDMNGVERWQPLFWIYTDETFNKK